MTDAATTNPDLSNDPYELALAMHERAVGFAFLLRCASDHWASVEDQSLAGVARIAEDIAGKAAELLEAARAQEWAIDRRDK